MMGKADFVKVLETLVIAAMDNIVGLDLARCNNEDFVLATCNSGAKYMINVTGNSHIGIAHDVINFLRFK